MDKSKIKILVVDDEQGLCAGVQEALRREGYVVDAMTDAPAALKLAQQRLYNLIISDMKMPGLTGLEFEGFLDQCPQAFHIDRLGQVVVSALFHGLDGVFNRAVSGHENEERIAVVGPNLGQQFQPTQAGHFHVRND